MTENIPDGMDTHLNGLRFYGKNALNAADLFDRLLRVDVKNIVQRTSVLCFCHIPILFNSEAYTIAPVLCFWHTADMSASSMKPS